MKSKKKTQKTPNPIWMLSQNSGKGRGGFLRTPKHPILPFQIQLGLPLQRNAREFSEGGEGGWSRDNIGSPDQHRRWKTR